MEQAKEQLERRGVHLARIDTLHQLATGLDGLKCIAKAMVLAQEALVGEHAIDQQDQLVLLDGLAQIVRRSHAQRLDGTVHRGVGREQDEGRFGMRAPDLLEKLEAGEALHLEIADDEVHRLTLEAFEGALTALDGLDVHLPGERVRSQLSHEARVVDEQDAGVAIGMLAHTLGISSYNPTVSAVRIAPLSLGMMGFRHAPERLGPISLGAAGIALLGCTVAGGCA
jgi:hypothetical protein